MLNDIKALFEEHDKDKSGLLDRQEMWSILEMFSLQPSDLLEQQAIVDILMDIDKNATGLLDIEQLSRVMQRIAEKLLYTQRKAQMSHGVALGWPPLQVVGLRHAFEELDEEHRGELPLEEIAKAVAMMEWKMSAPRLERMLQDADNNANGQIDFEEFLSLMW